MNEITEQVNDVRRVVGLYGEGQRIVRAHVAEAYSPSRGTCIAENMGLIPGLAMGQAARDERGDPWGFNSAAVRAKARNIINSKFALLLIGGPTCAASGRLQTFNAKRLAPEKMNDMMECGAKRFKFALELCEVK